MDSFAPKRILVPLDFSRVARVAWREARAVAERFDSRLEAVYVWQWLPRSFDEVARPLDPEQESRMRRQLAARVGSPVRVEEGDPLAVLLDAAAGFDLIVMGSHSRTRLGGLALGSLSEAVVRDSPIPVLVVPTRRRAVGLRGAGACMAGPVLAPVNFAPYSLETFRYAAQAAAAFAAPLHVLHVAGKGAPADARRLFKAWVEALSAPVRAKSLPVLIAREGDAVEQILAEAERSSLVALASHRKSFLGDMLWGTTVEQVLRRCPVAVLAVPARK